MNAGRLECVPLPGISPVAAYCENGRPAAGRAGKRFAAPAEPYGRGRIATCVRDTFAVPAPAAANAVIRRSSGRHVQQGGLVLAKLLFHLQQDLQTSTTACNEDLLIPVLDQIDRTATERLPDQSSDDRFLPRKSCGARRVYAKAIGRRCIQLAVLPRVRIEARIRDEQRAMNLHEFTLPRGCDTGQCRSTAGVS